MLQAHLGVSTSSPLCAREEEAASPPEASCVPCSLFRRTRCSSLLLWTPISLTCVYTVIEEEAHVHTLCNTVSLRGAVGSLELSVLGCVLASRRCTAQGCAAYRGRQAKVSVRARASHSWARLPRGVTEQEGNQCWARALPAAAALGCAGTRWGPSPCTLPCGNPGALFTWACMPCGGWAPGPAGVELLTVHRDGSRQELGTLNSGRAAQARATAHPDQTNLH